MEITKKEKKNLTILINSWRKVFDKIDKNYQKNKSLKNKYNIQIVEFIFNLNNLKDDKTLFDFKFTKNELLKDTVENNLELSENLLKTLESEYNLK